MLKLVFLGKFRALASDALNAGVPAEVATLADLMAWVACQDPALGAAMAATRTQLVLNHELARDLNCPISPGDEIAFLPPMSGG